MYEDHLLCAVALTGRARGAQTHPLASCVSSCDPPLLYVYSQVNTSVSYCLYYVENIYDGGPLCPCFNPQHKQPYVLPLPLAILYYTFLILLLQK